jgi:hypothetical protein
VQDVGGMEVSAPTVTEPPRESPNLAKIRRSLQNLTKIGHEIEGARVHRCYSTVLHGRAPCRPGGGGRGACGGGAGRLLRQQECAGGGRRAAAAGGRDAPAGVCRQRSGW